MTHGLSLATLAQEGPPVRLRDLCRLTGFSKEKFFADIERGKLLVTKVQTGRNILFVIERSEAHRYLREIGFSEGR